MPLVKFADPALERVPQPVNLLELPLRLGHLLVDTDLAAHLIDVFDAHRNDVEISAPIEECVFDGGCIICDVFGYNPLRFFASPAEPIPMAALPLMVVLVVLVLQD